MKIFDNQLISTPQSKFLEVGDKIVIDTNVYSSGSLAQIPYSQYINNKTNSKNVDAITSKTSKTKMYRNATNALSTTNYNFMLNYNSNSSIMDEYESGVYYILGDYISGYLDLRKVIVNGDKIVDTGLSYYQAYSMKYICQDKSYLYFTQSNHSNGTASQFPNTSSTVVTCIIVKIDKTTMVGTNSISINACNNLPQCVHYDDNYIHLVYQSINFVYYTRYQKSTNSFSNTVTPIKVNTGTSQCQRDFQINYMSSGNYKYLYYPNIANSATAVLSPGITMVKFDFSDTNVSTPAVINKTSDCTISWGAGNEAITTAFNTNFTRAYDSRVSFITNANSKTYLTFFIHSSCGDYVKANTGFFTFEVLSESELKYVSRLELDGTEKNPLFLGGDSINKIYVPSYNCVYYLNFNPVTESFEVVNSKPIVATSIGEDNLGRVWITDMNDQLHMFSESVVEKVNLKFMESNLEYVGDNISTNISINCVNNSGEKIVFSVDLTIVGNATFANGTRKLKVQTLAGSDLQVPITITGPGQISVYPKVVL